MQPSTQVTRIPEFGEIESSVLFFVKVAAEEFILEKVQGIIYSF
jgi:hypothetical protein